MKNVTVTLDEDVARWARIYAAQHDTSVSRLLGELLKERMESESRYESAQARFTSRKAVRLRKAGSKLPARDDLYDRGNR